MSSPPTGVVSRAGLDRARHEATGCTGTVMSPSRSYIGGALGGEVVDRLVDPLLGGVYAGRTEDLSFDATLAPLAAAAKHPTLTAAAASLLPPPPGATQRKRSRPVFVTLTTGLGALPQALARLPTPASAPVPWSASLRARKTGWRLTIGSAAGPEYMDADAVVLAFPAAPAARLLEDMAPERRGHLGEIPYASMAIITLAYRERTSRGSSAAATSCPPSTARP